MPERIDKRWTLARSGCGLFLAVAGGSVLLKLGQLGQQQYESWQRQNDLEATAIAQQLSNQEIVNEAFRNETVTLPNVKDIVFINIDSGRLILVALRTERNGEKEAHAVFENADCLYEIARKQNKLDATEATIQPSSLVVDRFAGEIHGHFPGLPTLGRLDRIRVGNDSQECPTSRALDLSEWVDIIGNLGNFFEE